MFDIASTQFTRVRFDLTEFPAPKNHTTHRFSMNEPTNSPPKTRGSGPLIIAILVLVLLVLHQDNWNWYSRTLVFGFMPIGLFWHACISVGATLTWFLATKIAWPVESPDQAARSEGGE